MRRDRRGCRAGPLRLLLDPDEGGRMSPFSCAAMPARAWFISPVRPIRSRDRSWPSLSSMERAAARLRTASNESISESVLAIPRLAELGEAALQV
jgi:hypothetical protein